MVVFSQCIDCKNLLEKKEDNKFCCKAFTEGIPEDIFWNKISHNQNIEGDKGIKFESIDK